MCHRAEFALECRPESVALGRHFIKESLVGWGVAEGDPAWDAVADVLLVASELLGNAVRVCARQITLIIEAHRDYIHLDVVDDNAAPAARRTSDADAVSGRGLGIVEALSDRWGQSGFNGFTKDVWADVSIQPGSVLADACSY
jgi:hypothetical protein